MAFCTPYALQDSSTQTADDIYEVPKNWAEPQKKVAQEFADKVSQIPDVLGVVATTHPHLLHIWTCLTLRIPREQEYAVYDAELEIHRKYRNHLPLDFESRSIKSTEQLKELLSCPHSYIVYQREEN